MAIRRAQEAGGKASILLFAAPKAVEYYPHIGFKAGSGWILRADEQLR